MNMRAIFTFWEPEHSVPAYLRLCRETWLRNSPGFALTASSYDSFEACTGPDVLDLDTLKTVRKLSADSRDGALHGVYLKARSNGARPSLMTDTA